MTRVRFAPSPTGFLHVGGARTALFNYLHARRTGGTFILRIEDTDRERSTDESEQAIYNALTWLGLDWDEGPGKEGAHGPYRQSERLDRYRQLANELITKERAYPCFCAPEPSGEKSSPGPYPGTCRSIPVAEAARRMAAGDPYAIRFRLQDDIVQLRDELRGDLSFEMTPVGDQVLIRRDGFPTYNFACVIDDADMEITDVIRGDDHLSNTPKQVLYYRALEKPLPRFTHVSMILGPDGERLSKRHGATSVEEFRDGGVLPESLLNFLALLGWSAGDDREFYTLHELTEVFDLKRVVTHAAVFNGEKLNWMNGQYLRRLDEPRYLELARPFLAARFPDLTSGQADAVLKALRNRIHRLGELEEAAGMFLDKDPAPDREDKETAEILADQAARGALQLFHGAYAALPADNPDAKPLFKQVMKEAGISGQQIYKPVRLALAGVPEGPGILDLLTVLGQEKSLARIQRFLDTWEA